jgi:hypothetical protein
MAAFPVSVVVPHRLASTIRTVVGGVPATVAVVFGVLILFIALFLNCHRQRYALKAAHCAFAVARGLIRSDSWPGDRPADVETSRLSESVR